MLIFTVDSIPLKDVIMSLAKSFATEYYYEGDEYFLYLPKNLGEGEIRGINFESGLGLLVYRVCFKKNVRLEFTKDEIHPVKFIYPLHGVLTHSFANENKQHIIAEYRSAIVASRRTHGHIIDFEKDTKYEIISLEIDRILFVKNSLFELENWDSDLRDVLRDVDAKKQFYHIENSGLFYGNILQDTEKYKDFALARRFNLEAITMQIFVAQIVQFDDDNLALPERTILRISELKKVEELGEYIKNNMTDDHSIKKMSSKTGLNPAKLQMAFQHLFSTSVNEFVINARLEHAYKMLQNKEYNVGDVVMAIGLESHSYFTRLFKKRYGITPTNFRKIFL